MKKLSENTKVRTAENQESETNLSFRDNRNLTAYKFDDFEMSKSHEIEPNNVMLFHQILPKCFHQE